jgi:hypothetical protein
LHGSAARQKKYDLPACLTGEQLAKLVYDELLDHYLGLDFSLR